MRHFLLVLACLLALVATACGGAPEGGGDVVLDAFDAATSTTVAPTTTSTTTLAPTTSTTSTPPTTTTTVPPYDPWNPVTFLDEDPDDFCGDDYAHVYAIGDWTCRKLETLPPPPVERGTWWLLPQVEERDLDALSWHQPLALFNWNTVSLLSIELFEDLPVVEPWAILDRWPDDVRIASDGTFVTLAPSDEEDMWIRYEVAVHRPDAGPPHVLDDSEWLRDVAFIEGRESIIYEPNPENEEAIGILAAPLDDTADVREVFGLAWDAATDTRIIGLDVHDDRAVVHGYRGDGMFIEVRDLDGNVLPVADPLEDSLFGEFVEVDDVVWGPNGARITYVETSSYEASGAPSTRISSMDVSTGERVFSIPIEECCIGGYSDPTISMFDLGDHVIVNIYGFWANRGWGEEALVLSFTADEPEYWRLNVTGIAVPVPYTIG